MGAEVRTVRWAAMAPATRGQGHRKALAEDAWRDVRRYERRGGADGQFVPADAKVLAADGTPLFGWGYRSNRVVGASARR